MEGYQTLRQLGFGLLDMAYHIKSEDVKDVKAFEDTQTKATQLYPVNPETAISPSFSSRISGRLRFRLLFLQMGRSAGCRCFCLF